MCGIGGVIASGPVPGLGDVLQRMQRALHHRGPDDQGVFTTPDGEAGMVHTRLAILDLSPAGHQPMTSPDGRFTIVFNGEIYNFREIRAGLAASGEEFRTGSDTEVILRLYQREGARCVERLRGMFAFAIWDSLERACFLARDPLGMKPLYLAQVDAPGGTTTVFGSEIRALLASGLVSRAVCLPAVVAYLRSGSVPEPLTILDGARCLPAGSTLHVRGGTVRQAAYWSLPAVPAAGSDVGADRRMAVAATREALLDSVRAHFVSDVPVGLFLSGGIDSSAILALSTASGRTGLETFSMSFGDPANDEAVIAARTAAQFGARHHDCAIDGRESRALLDGFFRHLDQPTVDGFNTWCISRAAREHGMKVVLSGLGGDELFGGYPSFQQVPLLARAGLVPRLLRAPVGRAIEGVARGPQRRRLGEYLRGDGTLEAAWEAARGLFTDGDARRLAAWITGASALPPDPATGRDGIRGEDPRAAVRRLETTRYMRNQLLRDSDVMSMAWGLELRVPLVDRVLVEAVATLPLGEQLRPGKQLLVDAVPEIPDWVVRRRKTGFTFPFARWLDAEWRDLSSVTEGAPIPLVTWYQRWAIVVLRQWLAQL